MVVANLTDALNHILNFNPAQVAQPTSMALLVLTLVIFMFVGVALRHAIGLSLAIIVIMVLLAVSTGASPGGFGSFFTTLWALVQPLGSGVLTLALSSGVYSMAAAAVGLALGWLFTRT
ncbi:MAG: hypothetical protein KGI71_04585 [Patescibacteria group bacterium]|nr:hypothetical protein [Patescibacteria group bacterium]